MAEKAYSVTVIQTERVKIVYDPDKFTPEFMEEFRKSFYPFFTVEDHLDHLAQLQARGLAYGFVEGYGELAKMGINFHSPDGPGDVEFQDREHEEGA